MLKLFRHTSYPPKGILRRRRRVAHAANRVSFLNKSMIGGELGAAISMYDEWRSQRELAQRFPHCVDNLFSGYLTFFCVRNYKIGNQEARRVVEAEEYGEAIFWLFSIFSF